MSVLWQSLQRRRADVHMAHVLKKITVAEHCESKAMITQLRELGVDKIQGYGIHKPQPIDDYFQQAD